MIITGNLSSNKTDILIDKYVNLLNNGVSSREILVLVQNSNLKQDFIDKTLDKLTINAIEKLQVYSFFSLVYNTVSDNWAFLEDRNKFDNPQILPNLVGLEVSQFIMKEILKEVKFKGYNSRLSLLQQLFRRYSLIVQNNLSKKDIQDRAKILKEGFSDEADIAINRFLSRTLQLRDFDYLRQCLLFNFIYKNTDYFKDIKYLLVDDGDEYSPITIDFIEYLSKQLTKAYIAIDPLGSSRCGYLSADKNNYAKLVKIFGNDIIATNEDVKLTRLANDLYNNVLLEDKKVLSNCSNLSFSKRTEMINYAITQIRTLLNKNVSPCEIAIISPVIDNMLKFSLKEQLSKNLNLLYLSGNEKLIQNKAVKACLTILKLNTDLVALVDKFDLRVILSDFLQIPIKYCEEILESFEQYKKLLPYEFKDEDYTNSYKKLISLVDRLSNTNEKISEQIIKIYNEIFDIRFLSTDEINKFNFFIKQIRDFEDVFGASFNSKKTDIILQIENSIIAENPYSILEIKSHDLVIATPQKIIDNHIKTKYQIWLDISSSEWVKSDVGPLYNAWVFQKDWEKEEYTLDDNIRLSKDKTARVLRKLMLLAGEKVYCASSLFDSNGVENYGGIEEYIITEQEQKQENDIPVFKITPRKDQQPVLDYQKGYMGISAVPGAGKTTILLALIIKLLENGIQPDKIFVLTYMESAARNFRERIKLVRGNNSKLPNISTIHGLALKILKDNGNYEKLGLSSDFEICDDAMRSRILKTISLKLKIKEKELSDFDRAVSTLKMGGGDIKKATSENLKNFKLFFELYQENLREFNLIDYDDMLSGSVKLLKQNPDILAHYQEVCEYLIEDEAQDSSSVQQELITLLSGKHKNIIRCGDVNQSITMTFSNADVEGFRNFITTNNNVSMNCSQRCTKEVWHLANTLVEYYSKFPESKNAFYPMLMEPVEGKNPPPLGKGVNSEIFETPTDEKNYVLKLIKKTLTINPKATIGILLRFNYQVAEWQNLLENSGLSVITRNQCLEQKAIFKVIFACLNLVLKPFDNNLVAQNYEVLAEFGFYKRGLGAEISKYENPFITISPDNIENKDLEQFLWDLNEWSTFSSYTPDEIAIKIGTQFFSSEIEKANIHLISTLIKRICISNNSLDYAITRLKELSKKANLSGFKFFSEEDEEDKSFLEGKIQIMTMHKSKGDEFNLVVIPELSEKNLPLTLDNIQLKSSEFIENVKSLNENYKRKSDYELKQEILAENLRLLYVAVTRAKNSLYITTSKKVKYYGKYKDNEISPIFDEILGGVYV